MFILTGQLISFKQGIANISLKLVSSLILSKGPGIEQNLLFNFEIDVIEVVACFTG